MPKILFSMGNSVKRGNGTTGLFNMWRRRVQINVTGLIKLPLTSQLIIDENDVPIDIWEIAELDGKDLRAAWDSGSTQEAELYLKSYDSDNKNFEVRIKITPEIAASEVKSLYLFYGCRRTSGSGYGPFTGPINHPSNVNKKKIFPVIPSHGV